MKIQRIRDKQFIKLFEEAPGYRHVVTTTDLSQAQEFSEEDCVKICDHDFFGMPYNASGYNKRKRKPEYHRWQV